MNYQTLAVTVVSGILALGLLIATTVLLVSKIEVPPEFVPAFLLLIGISVGGASKAPAP